MRHAWLSAILFLVACGSANSTRAQEPALKIPSELILERFQVNKGGDALLVPMKIAGNERLFLVDTGFTYTAVDLAIPLGEPTRIVTGDGNGGQKKLKIYRSPEASVGRLQLGIEHVLGMDMKPLGEALGCPIEGVLGMDFLRRQVVHIDFDQGELFLLKSVPGDSGQIFPIGWRANGLPEIEAKISSKQNAKFLIDTGLLTSYSGFLNTNSLNRSHEFRKVGAISTLGASGTYNASIFQGHHLSLGRFSVEEPIFQESPDISILGLHFWSRFVVTFDFPNQKIYLRNGEGYERRDLRDRSGLYLVLKNGSIVVNHVDSFSPAASSGFKEGDILLTLGVKRIEEISPYERQKLLCIPGKLACTIRRGSHEHHLTLNLPR